MLLAKGAIAGPDTIVAGDLYKVSIPVAVTGNALGDVYSNSFVADSPSLTARRPASAVVTTRVQAPDLVISKSVSPSLTVPGGSVSYAIIVKNSSASGVGPILATPVPTIRVTDSLPADLTLTSAPAGTNWDCAASAGNNVDCTYKGPLPMGAGATVGGAITFDADVALTVVQSQSIANSAAVGMSGQGEDSTSNNEDVAAFRIQLPPDVAITKTVSSPQVVQGFPFSYNLSVDMSNAGGPIYQGPITVTDTLPAGVTISAATDVTGTSWNCLASAPPSTVSCTYTGSFPRASGAVVCGVLDNADAVFAAGSGTLGGTTAAFTANSVALKPVATAAVLTLTLNFKLLPNCYDDVATRRLCVAILASSAVAPRQRGPEFRPRRLGIRHGGLWHPAI